MSLHQPRWKEGATIGRLTVARVVGRQLVRSGKAKMWVYECLCSCGKVETLTQEKLVGGRVDCCECMIKRRHTRSSPTFISHSELPDNVPDPATLPAPGCIKTGPEKY